VTLLAVWLAYTVFGVGFFSLIFWWAVRTRQFGGQERARYMALQEPSEVKPTAGETTETGLISPALYVPLVLLLIACALLGGPLWFILTR
jgi:nitrogen fixation-related uncharacterized protein